MFIAVDGIDGSGKTTLVRHLVELFHCWDPYVTKEPTDNSKWGRILRDSAQKGRLSRELELDYFCKDRQLHIKNEILPALGDEKVVITDRYVDSTLAFQCSSPDEADELYEDLVSEILVPDITFILDCTVEIGLARIKKRDGDKLSAFETQRTLETAKSIYESRNAGHYEHLDATKSSENTFHQAIEAIQRRSLEWRERLEQVDNSLCKIPSIAIQSEKLRA